jgi:uncharacterized protein (DUF433 family)
MSYGQTSLPAIQIEKKGVSIMPALTIEPVAVPLRQDADGVVRVGDSRVLLELVIRAFQQGATPESIVQSYNTLKLADVYAVLAYCLTHQEQVDAYMRRCDDESDELRRRIEAAQPDRSDLRERLMQRAKAMDGA